MYFFASTSFISEKNQIDANAQMVPISLNNGRPCNITVSGIAQTVQLEANAFPNRTITDLIQLFILAIVPYLGTFLLVGKHLNSKYTELNLSDVIKNHRGDPLLNIKYKVIAKNLDQLLHNNHLGVLGYGRYPILLVGWKEKEVGVRLVEVLLENRLILSLDTKVASIWSE